MKINKKGRLIFFFVISNLLVECMNFELLNAVRDFSCESSLERRSSTSSEALFDQILDISWPDALHTNL